VQAQNESANLFSSVRSEEFHHYLAQADSLYKINNYKKAIPLYKTCLQQLKSSNEKHIVLHKIGNSFKNISEHDSAVHYLTLALQSNVSDVEYLNKTKSMLGVTYSRTGDYKLAKKYLQEAYEYYLQEKKDSVAIASAIVDLGAVYSGEKNYEKAIELYKQTLLFITAHNKIGLSTTLGNIGSTYYEMQRLDSAKVYIKKALKISREINDIEGIIINLHNLAYFEQTKGNYQHAIPYYTESLQLSDSLKNPYYKIKILYNISANYDSIGNDKLALKYLQQAREEDDKIYNEEKTKAIAEMQEKYEAVERERQIADMKLVKQKDEAEKLALKNAILIGLFILIIIGIIIRLRVVKARNERHLAVITATIDAQEQERARISQEVHDDLGGMLGMTRMLFTNTRTFFKEPKDEDLYNRLDGLLLQANKRSRAISHELFSPTLRVFGLHKAIQELVDTLKAAHPSINFKYTALIRKELTDKNLELNLYRITQELMSNCLKYANATEVELVLLIDNSSVQLKYSDNGKGFDVDTAKKGVGLLSITSRVKRFQGKLNISSQLNGGTQISISVDLKNIPQQVA
jgi:signal transduction histidine kinase